MRLVDRAGLLVSFGLLACGGTPGQPGGTGGAGVGTGGASTGTGGAAGSTGGASGVSGFEEVRCFRYAAAGIDYCSGRLGNLWATVAPVCLLDGRPHLPMDLNLTECGDADSAAGWDETFCDDVACYGRLGTWVVQLAAPCQLPGQVPDPRTPTELLCETAAQAPAGWDDVGCHVIPGGAGDFIRCYGFHGLYFPGMGLFPTCALATYEDNPDFSEIAPADAYCE